MEYRKVINVGGTNLLAPDERTCAKCGGRLESKGIRRETRRYRCLKCKSNAGSIPITEKEEESLRVKDKGIGDLALAERYDEIRGLERKKQPYCLLTKYDPKYCSKKSIKSRFRNNYSEVIGYEDWAEQLEVTKKFTKRMLHFWKNRS